jgi:hypothetical protein
MPIDGVPRQGGSARRRPLRAVIDRASTFQEAVAATVSAESGRSPPSSCTAAVGFGGGPDRLQRPLQLVAQAGRGSLANGEACARGWLPGSGRSCLGGRHRDSWIVPSMFTLLPHGSWRMAEAPELPADPLASLPLGWTRSSPIRRGRRCCGWGWCWPRAGPSGWNRSREVAPRRCFGWGLSLVERAVRWPDGNGASLAAVQGETLSSRSASTWTSRPSTAARSCSLPRYSTANTRQPAKATTPWPVP